MSMLARQLTQGMQERGCEIRTFMPRYGVINERRNQLHEVIRLSGMNIIIDNDDHQLIIKVASIPAARVQIYFIDNDDYFSRKAVLKDTTTGEPFADNGQRAVFFARGVLETVRKLRWQPNIVHCHGWFTAVLPLYLRNTLSDDPLFADAKIVFTIYDDDFTGAWNTEFLDTMRGEGIAQQQLDIISPASYQNLMKLVIQQVDGIVVEAHSLPQQLEEYLLASGKPVLRGTDRSDGEWLNSYKTFYENIIK